MFVVETVSNLESVNGSLVAVSVGGKELIFVAFVVGVL